MNIDMSMEIWKDINEYEGYYQVSNYGRVRRLPRLKIYDNGKNKKAKAILPSKIIKVTKQTQGYSQVCLSKNNIRISKRLNRLVANAFIENTENKPEVNHIDGNKDNNRADNLEWVTRKENSRHAVDNNLYKHWTRKVKKIDSDGRVIEKYDSVKEAAIKNGTVKSNICLACRGKVKFACGYRWEYDE